MKNCKTCIHFANNQRLLNYYEHTGFCLCPDMSFNNKDGRRCGVIDTQNIKDQTKVSGNPAHDFEHMKNISPEFSRYLLQVGEGFGCIFHKEKPKK